MEKKLIGSFLEKKNNKLSIVMRCDITFNAFIGGSIGQSLYDYFRDHPLNNPDIMKNHQAFNSKLRRISGSWFPEPGYGAVSNKFVKTDDREFGGGRSRLFVKASINLATIGNMQYSPFQRPDCDESHRRSVYIDHPNRSNRRQYMPDLRVNGVVRPEDRAKEGEAKSAPGSVKNTIVGSYFTRPGTPRSELCDGTEIKVGASAGYPYMEPISPNIDFDLTFTLHKVNRRHVRIMVKGQHDGFPCYELIVNNKLEYTYYPPDFNQHGPTPFNLNSIVRNAGNDGYFRNEGKHFSTVINLRLPAPLPKKSKKEVFPPAVNLNRSH